MRTALILAAALMASPAAAASTPDATYTSAKAPAVIAACIDKTLSGTKSRQLAPDAYEATRKNLYGMVLVRWEIRAAAEGSAIDFNHRFGFNSGRDKAARCF